VGKRWIQTSCLIHNRQPRLDAMHEQMLRIVLRPCVEQQQEEESFAASWSPNSSIFCGLAAACSDRQPRRLQPPDPLTPHLLQPDHQTHTMGNRETGKHRHPDYRPWQEWIRWSLSWTAPGSTFLSLLTAHCPLPPAISACKASSTSPGCNPGSDPQRRCTPCKGSSQIWRRQRPSNAHVEK
jgi:hypothetical protein